MRALVGALRASSPARVDQCIVDTELRRTMRTGGTFTDDIVNELTNVSIENYSLSQLQVPMSFPKVSFRSPNSGCRSAGLSQLLNAAAAPGVQHSAPNLRHHFEQCSLRRMKPFDACMFALLELLDQSRRSPNLQTISGYCPAVVHPKNTRYKGGNSDRRIYDVDGCG
jgi:hypothetical protein